MKLANVSRRTWIIGTVVILIIGFIFLVSAPTTNRISSGSTWGTPPDGYRAWYDYMADEGVSVERWQRPIEDLVDQVVSGNDSGDAQTSAQQSTATLLVILPPVLDSKRFNILSYLFPWFEAGHQVIMLTSQQDVTAAPFSSQLPSEVGAVTIETRRRRPINASPEVPKAIQVRQSQNNAEPSSSEGNTSGASKKNLLIDEFGAVVWQQQREQGRLISTTTPFLAANAYADEPGNLAFLSELVQSAGGPIYVDEYVHGYKERDVVVREVAGTWTSYLAKTPLLLVSVQALVLLLIGLLAQNRRFGQAQSIPPVQINNSVAYIQALAGVLHKANNHDFLVETLTRAEQKSLQRALGLGDAPVSPDTLQTAWEQTTGRSASELSVLQRAPKSGLSGESMLRAWLQRLQALHVVASARSKETSRPIQE